MSRPGASALDSDVSTTPAGRPIFEGESLRRLPAFSGQRGFSFCPDAPDHRRLRDDDPFWALPRRLALIPTPAARQEVALCYLLKQLYFSLFSASNENNSASDLIIFF